MVTEQRRIEAEIEAGRARLGDTLDRLKSRLTPAGIVEDALAKVRGTSDGASLYDGALRAVRERPVAVLLIAAGAGMLLRRATGHSPQTWLAERGPDIARPPSRRLEPGAPGGR